MPKVCCGAAADDQIAFRRRADGGFTLAAGGAADLFVGPDAFRALRQYLPLLRTDPLGARLFPAAPAGFPDAWSTARRWSPDSQSPFERMRILDPKTNPRKLRAIKREFAALFPGLGRIRLEKAWAGMIDVMPDVVPVLDRATAIPGLTIGTGLSGHGFGIGPGIGRILAALVMGADVGHDLRRFRLSRFADGTPIRPGPSL